MLVDWRVAIGRFVGFGGVVSSFCLGSFQDIFWVNKVTLHQAWINVISGVVFPWQITTCNISGRRFGRYTISVHLVEIICLHLLDTVMNRFHSNIRSISWPAARRSVCFVRRIQVSCVFQKIPSRMEQKKSQQTIYALENIHTTSWGSICFLKKHPKGGSDLASM